MPIPYINTEKMREVDRLMIEEYHIGLIQMMENAGRNLAHLARLRFLDGDPRDKQVVVLAGRGGNGGGGLVTARRLRNWGANVQVFTTHPQTDYADIPAKQFDILARMGVPVSSDVSELAETTAVDLIIDAVIGYSLSGDVHGIAADFIQWANAQTASILSLDTPSGLDTTTGIVYKPCIHAAATMTLALPKEGLKNGLEAGVVGELYLADISVPPELYAHEGIDLEVGPIFSHEDIIRLE